MNYTLNTDFSSLNGPKAAPKNGRVAGSHFVKGGASKGGRKNRDAVLVMERAGQETSGG